MAERGSFQWWAELCRMPTAVTITDSGMAYGYRWEQPVPSEDGPAAYVHVLAENWYAIKVSTPHWLANTFDAADPVAMALEELLHWLADEKYQSETWYTVIRAFPKELGHMGLYLDGETFRLIPYLQRTAPYARTAFPIEALQRVAQAGLLKNAPVALGYNSYNFDNDLDQVVQCDLVIDEQYHILRIHTGCDVRSGYTAPIVARSYSGELAIPWQVAFLCLECDHEYDSASELNRGYEDMPEVDAILAASSGQPILPKVGERLDPAEVFFLCPQCGAYDVVPMLW